MASSDVDPPWNFRPSSFIHNYFSMSLNTEIQQSLSNSDSFSSDTTEALSSFLSNDTVLTPTPVDSATKRHRSSRPITRGKVSKRKPRKSKRSEMTFIYADQANFRQMVQQVTGASFIDAQLSQILKPEPMRSDGGHCLDTAAHGSEVDVGDVHGLNSRACFPTLESWNHVMGSC